MRRLAAQGFTALKHTRWCFLKRPKNLTSDQRRKLKDVLQYNLRIVRPICTGRLSRGFEVSLSSLGFSTAGASA